MFKTVLCAVTIVFSVTGHTQKILCTECVYRTNVYATDRQPDAAVDFHIITDGNFYRITAKSKLRGNTTSTDETLDTFLLVKSTNMLYIFNSRQVTSFKPALLKAVSQTNKNLLQTYVSDIQPNDSFLVDRTLPSAVTPFPQYSNRFGVRKVQTKEFVCELVSVGQRQFDFRPLRQQVNSFLPRDAEADSYGGR